MQFDILARRILGTLRIDLHQQQMVGAESHVHRAQPDERSQEQACSNDQHCRERDLKSHECPAAKPSPAAGSRLRCFFQPAIHVIASSRECRREPKQHSGQQRDPGSKGKDSPVEVNIEIGALPGHFEHARDHVAAQISGQQSKCPSQRGQHQALYQHLTQNSRPSGSQCHAYADLPLTAGSASEHQVGNVGAGKQQHKSYRCHQHGHRLGKH